MIIVNAMLVNKNNNNSYKEDADDVKNNFKCLAIILYHMATKLVTLFTRK